MAGAPTDWQLGCIEVKQRGAYLLRSGQWSDCTFLVGNEPNQITIPGHKLILAMASPVFEAMFYGGMAERNEPIPILDVQPDAFKALLDYIYSDDINITSFDKACELCYGAKKYMLPHLVKECTRYLWSDLYPRNACRAYEFARLFEENVLMEKCIQIISTNTKEVLNDSSFEDVDLNTVITVFSLDHLNVDNELDLFQAAVRYAKAQEKNNERSVSPPNENGPPSQKRSKSPAPSTSKDKLSVVNIESSNENSPIAVDIQKTSEVPEVATPPVADENAKKPDTNNKPNIRKAIEKIRFLTLTPQQFAEGPARSSLLTESEAFAVLMNILSSNSDVPMPSGFSTCRVPRKQLIGEGSSSNMVSFTVDTPSPVMLEQVFGAPSQNVPPYPRPTRHDEMPALLTCRLSSANHEAPFGVRTSSMVQPTVNPNQSVGADNSDRQGMANVDFNKIYCQRAIIHHTDCLNTSVLDCSVTFMVDKNICLLGIQVPTQAPSEEGAGGGAGAGGYCELLYAHLLDADGARLTYTHYTNRVPYRHLLDIMFNRPVYIQRNKVYKVGIVFNKMGWYPMGICAQQVAAESVFFNFGIGQSSDSVRDGLIRSIIFTY